MRLTLNRKRGKILKAVKNLNAKKKTFKLSQKWQETTTKKRKTKNKTTKSQKWRVEKRKKNKETKEC